MTGIVRIGATIFVKDEDKSVPKMEQYRAQIAGIKYQLQIDYTMGTPYYEVFLEWEDEGRPQLRRVFATSSIEKLHVYFTK